MSYLTVGLVSDTHGWLDPALCEVFQNVHCIIHAGDIGQESVIKDLEKIATVHVVRGNIDGGELRFYPLEKVVEVGSKRIAILHIAGSPRRPNAHAREFLSREKPDVIVVGHSHIPVVGKIHGTLWINPGAAGRYGFHDERYAALLHVPIGEGEITMDRVHLGPRSKGEVM